jgi:GDP-mannose 6-dehydrogenase
MRISVFGLGYVGSVTAACLAKAGHDVIGVDVNPEKTAMINEGKSPVIEPGLDDLVAEMVRDRRLRATVSADWAVKHSDMAMICVGTPSASNGRIDTSSIECVTQDIGRAIEHRSYLFTVVLRSTVLPGTTEAVVARVLREWLGAAFEERVAMAMNPEFMREGTSIADFEHPPMTVVGCADAATAARVRALYQHVDAPFLQTSIRVAEMVKYVSNAFHALKICFANEIGDLCEAMDVDAREVSRAFLMDRKLNISEAYLRPGFAFGGSCLPKDLRALMYAAHASYIQVPLLASIQESNEHQIDRGVAAILRTGKKRIGVIGLAFKADTDDLRESPMVTVVETLIGKGCSVRIFDSNVRLAALVGANRRYIETEIPHISQLICDDLRALTAEADVIVIGATGKEAARAVELCRPDQIIIDLTRNAAARPKAAAREVLAARDFVAQEMNA